MLKPLANQKCYGGRDVRTDRHGKVKSRVSATKNVNNNNFFSPLYPFWAAALEGKFFHVLLLRLLCPPPPNIQVSASRTKSQLQGPNPCLKAQSLPHGPIPRLKAQIPALFPVQKPKSQPRGLNLSPEART